MKPPVLEHGAFTLRLPRAEDVSWIYHACQDEDVQRFTAVPSPYGPADAIAWVGSAAEACAAGTELHLLVSLTESGELMGAAGLNLTPGEGRAEIGYWVERDARRRGAARAAIGALEAFAMSPLHLHETTLRIAETNVASLALAVSCDYVLSGRDEEPCKGLPALRFAKRLDRDQPASD